MIDVVFFRAGGHAIAIPVERVVEILPVVEMAAVPDAPPYVVGMMNCRGRLIPVVDLAVRLRLSAPRPPHPLAHVLVVRLQDGPLGCLVDQVVDVSSVADADLLPTSRVAPEDVPLDIGLLAAAVRRPDGAVPVIDLGRVLSDADRRALAPASGAVA